MIFGIIDAAAQASADQVRHLRSAAPNRRSSRTPEVDATFQLLFSPSIRLRRPRASWIQRHGPEAVGASATAHDHADPAGGAGEARGDSRPADLCVRPPALPGGSNFPVEFVIASTDEPDRMLQYAQKLQTKAMESGEFYFPPQIDLKYDQPQTEIVIDHDKVAALGLNLRQVGADLGCGARRQLRQSLQHRGAQLQGDPAGRARASG